MMDKIKISHADFIERKMSAVRAYIGVAKSCRPAALHAAMLTIFDVQDAPPNNWQSIDIEAFKNAVASARDDDDFREQLSGLPISPPKKDRAGK